MEKKEINLKESSLKKIMNLPDAISFLNLLFGLAAIYFAIEKNFIFSSVAIIIAAIMDYLDGKIANWLKQTTEFGKEIDSLADMVSFGVAPALFGYFYASPSVLLLISIVFFIICGATRLARYNIIDYNKHFIGVPITINAFIFPLIYFFSVPQYALPFIYFILGILMVSSIKVRRLP